MDLQAWHTYKEDEEDYDKEKEVVVDVAASM